MIAFVALFGTLGVLNYSYAYRLAFDVRNTSGELIYTTCFLSGGTCLPTVVVTPGDDDLEEGVG